MATGAILGYQVPGQHEYDGMLLQSHVYGQDQLDRIRYQMDFNCQDVISASYPKTGCTWVLEMLSLIMSQNSSKLQSIFLDMNFDYAQLNLDIVENMPSPRLVKSHLPLRYFRRNIDKMAAGPKVIVPTRNPKDTLVSYFHFYRMNPRLGHFQGSWDDFFELFRHRRLVAGDMFDFTVDWWMVRDHPNVLVVKFEDLHRDPCGSIHQMASFINRPLTDEQVMRVAEGASFDQMTDTKASFHQEKYDETVSRFLRKGKVGDWVNYFNEEQSAYIDQLCAERFQPIGLKYEYVL